MRRLLASLCAAALALTAAGCGENGSPGGAEPRANDYVDPAGEPPGINSLDVEPGSRHLLLTTNRGFFRIDPANGQAERIEATIETRSASSPVGRFLYVKPIGPDEYIGSGHPDEPSLPQFLGLIGSVDRGRTWTVLARLGEADLHKIELVHDRLYAFDAVLDALLISEDEGRGFTERFTPRGLVIDFVVDPEDGDHLLASTEEQLFRTEDQGETWRPVQAGEEIRLDWPAADALYRAQADGLIERSRDGGRTWERVSHVDGVPHKFKSVSAEELYLALGDATILHTRDGGRTWERVFEP
jgi:photosystem II stability/assembly factor-like uncharacterized protein